MTKARVGKETLFAVYLAPSDGGRVRPHAHMERHAVWHAAARRALVDVSLARGLRHQDHRRTAVDGGSERQQDSVDASLGLDSEGTDSSALATAVLGETLINSSGGDPRGGLSTGSVLGDALNKGMPPFVGSYACLALTV